MSRSTKRGEHGQALVELALALPIFLVLLLGVFSLGVGVYTWNGLSEASREIARTSSVYPAVILGASTETRRTVASQLTLVPGMADPPPANFTCVDIAGVPVAHVPCTSGDFVQVTVTATYYPVALLRIGGQITMSSTSSAQIP
jgi:Flp pilus assembly protein TadG